MLCHCVAASPHHATLQLPLSFRFSLCFCVSVCFSLSVRFALILCVFASLPELSLTLSCLPAITNSPVLSLSHVFAVFHIWTDYFAALFVFVKFLISQKLRSATVLKRASLKRRNASRQRYQVADLDKTPWLLWLCSALWQECVLMSGLKRCKLEMIFHTQNVNIMNTGFQNMPGMSFSHRLYMKELQVSDSSVCTSLICTSEHGHSW